MLKHTILTAIAGCCLVFSGVTLAQASEGSEQKTAHTSDAAGRLPMHGPMMHKHMMMKKHHKAM